MGSCRIAACSSLLLFEIGSASRRRISRNLSSSIFLSQKPLSSLSQYFPISTNQSSKNSRHGISTSSFSSIQVAESSETHSLDTVEHLLTHSDDVSKIMKMERRKPNFDLIGGEPAWFPYTDKFSYGNSCLNSAEVLEALDSLILDSRKERFKNVVRNRSYSVCLVVEGLSDFGNVSATFRSADALGFQSVHVVSCDASKRCNDHGGIERIVMLAWEQRNGWTLNFGIPPQNVSKC